MIIQHEHQKNVMRHVFGDQADDVTAWINEHLTSPASETAVGASPEEGREVPVRIFTQVADHPLNQVATVTVTDRKNYNRQVADALRALADEFDKPTGN